VYAIKVMQQFHNYLTSELASAKLLSHTNVVTVHESFFSLVENAGEFFRG
jgi:hypothetical protein